MPTVDELRIILDAETARLTKRLSAADQFMRGFERSTQQRLQRIDGYFKSFMAGGAAIGGGLGAGALIEYANAWTRVERSLSANSDIFGMPLHSAQELVKFANDARIGVEEFTKTYFRSAAAIRDLGFGAETAAKMTSTLAMALKLGGATMAEQQSVLLQFSQALNKGKLDGDEFRSVMEAAPVIVELLSKRLKISKGEIIDWAGQGKLKVRDLVGALTDGGESIERIFKRMPQTIDESLSVLRNAVIQYVGERDKMVGGTEKLAGLIGGAARNFDTIADSAAVAAVSLLSLFGPRMIAAVGRFALGAGAVTGPLGIVMALVAGGAAALELFGDKVIVSSDGIVTMKDWSAALAGTLGEQLTPEVKKLGKEMEVTTGQLVAAMEQGDASANKMAVSWTAVRAPINTIIGLTVYALRVIGAGFTALPSVIGEAFVGMANGVISLVETLVKDVTSLLNKIPGMKIEVDIPRIPNPYSGSFGATLNMWGDAAKESFGDWVQFALDGMNKVDARAREIAEQRRYDEYEAQRNAARMRRNLSGTGVDVTKPKVDEKLAAQLRKAREEVMGVYRKALEATKQYSGAVMEEHDKELRKFQLMLQQKRISDAEFQNARQNLAIITAQKLNEAAEKEWEKLRESTDAIASSMSSAFDEFVKSGKFNFKDFAASVLQDMAKMAFKWAVLQPLFGKSNEGFGLIGKVLGIGGGTLGSPVAPPIAGARASGGPVSAYRPYLVGERGPELVVPRAPGTVIPNHVLGGAMSSPASGGLSVTINAPINAPGADPAQLARVTRELAVLRETLPKQVAAIQRQQNVRGTRA